MRFLCGKINKLCFVLIFSVISLVCTGAHAAENAAEFILGSENCGGSVVYATLGNATLTASADGINGEKIRWDTDPSMLAPRMQGKKLAAGWGVGGYWMIEFSAENLSGLTLSADMFSSGKGPKCFELYFGTDGVNYTKIEDSAVLLSKSNQTVYDKFRLPDDLNNEKKVYIKIAICSKESVNGGDITGLKDGSTYINNIIISANGAEKPGGEDDGDGDVKTYYNKTVNVKMQRVGRPTGRYIFSVQRR